MHIGTRRLTTYGRGTRGGHQADVADQRLFRRLLAVKRGTDGVLPQPHDIACHNSPTAPGFRHITKVPLFTCCATEDSPSRNRPTDEPFLDKQYLYSMSSIVHQPAEICLRRAGLTSLMRTATAAKAERMSETRPPRFSALALTPRFERLPCCCCIPHTPAV